MNIHDFQYYIIRINKSQTGKINFRKIALLCLKKNGSAFQNTPESIVGDFFSQIIAVGRNLSQSGPFHLKEYLFSWQNLNLLR